MSFKASAKTTAGNPQAAVSLKACITKLAQQKRLLAGVPIEVLAVESSGAGARETVHLQFRATDSAKAAVKLADGSRVFPSCGPVFSFTMSGQYTLDENLQSLKDFYSQLASRAAVPPKLSKIAPQPRALTV